MQTRSDLLEDNAPAEKPPFITSVAIDGLESVPCYLRTNNQANE